MRTVWIALSASLALNVFLIGAGAGFVLSHHGPPPFGAGPHGLRAAAGRLSAQDREGLRRVLRAQAAQNAPAIAAARADAHAVADLLRRTPFDEAAARARLAAARAEEAGARERVETALLDYAASLAPEERAQLADIFEHGPRRPPPPFGWFHGGPDAPPPGPPAAPSDPAP